MERAVDYRDVVQSPLRLALALAIVIACSSSYDFTIRATLAPDLVVPDGAEVVMGGSSLDESDGSIFDVRGRGGPARTMDGVRSFERESSVCCSAGGDTLNIYAYIDLDGSLTWDPGEPWGADPNNPVRIDESGYVSEIEIVEDP